MKAPKTTQLPDLDTQENALLERMDEITRALVDIRGQSRDCQLLLNELDQVTQQLEAISQLRCIRNQNQCVA